jgi:asparagine synthase (glutamine-hydrolysing)
MAGIIGIANPNKQDTAKKMLDKIAHRGRYGNEIFNNEYFTLGVTWNALERKDVLQNIEMLKLVDGGDNFRFANVTVFNENIVLTRDLLGIAPLYYGENNDGQLCFSSEVKALIGLTSHIHELLPGHSFDGKDKVKEYNLQQKSPINETPEVIAAELYNRLDKAIASCIKFDSIGSWLSGGLDSSTISAIAKKHISKLHTFAAGVKDAPDFEYAAMVAKHIKSEHHQIVVGLQDMVNVLPEVIYHLESFDALLVRSSIINYLASKEASNYIYEVFSGEVGDELFAGYSYLKTLPENQLDVELIDITKRLHNTALQRVDRCSAAFGITPHVPFADPYVFEYALTIPVKYKLHNGIEKWILRKAIEKDLPQKVLNRPKAKFWEGGGVGELLADYASRKITDNDFQKERYLPNGWVLNSKEELMYYRIFKEHFGELENLDWMGRSK